MAYTDLPVGSTITGGVITVPVGNNAIAAGNLRLRVKAMGGNNAGDVLTNPVAFTVSGGGSGYDSDAEAYFTAMEAAEPGSLDTPQKDALNDWWVGEKAAGDYSKYSDGFYPMLGTTEAAMKINAYDPGTNDLVFDGGTWDFNAMGMRQTGAQNGAGVARRPVGVGLEPEQNNNFFAVYITEDTTSNPAIAANGWDAGAADGVFSNLGVYDGDVYTRNSTSANDGTPNTGGMIGFHIVTRVEAPRYHYIRRGTVHTYEKPSESQHTTAVAIGGFYGLGNGSTQRRYGFAIFGADLTPAEAVAATTRMNALQTALSRA